MTSLATRKAAVLELQNKYGQVTPDLLVKAAKNPSHPLHDELPKDAGKALLQQQKVWARGVIHSVRLVVYYGDVRTVTPLFVRNPVCAPKIQGYANIEFMENDDATESIGRDLSKIENAIRSLRIKAAALDLAGPLDEMLKQSAILRAAIGMRKDVSRRPRREEEDRLAAM